jgi:hypothetical protein
MNIREINIKFSTEEQCLTYIEKMRWPDGIITCPKCESADVKKYDRPREQKRKTRSETRSKDKFNRRQWFYICLNPECRHQFSPTAGTVFADTHLALITWFHAIALVLNAKKGISAKQLQRDLGIGGYKTAWYLLHRIRESFPDIQPNPLSGTVEVDETYIGGKQIGKGVLAGKRNKMTVMGAVERGGEVRFRHVADAKSTTIRGFISTNISPEAERIMTDQNHAYPSALAPWFKDRHFTVNHIAREYVRGDVTTNGIESAFSLIKRGIIGQYHKLSIWHLHRYLSEFEYRFNRRKDADVFIETVARLCRVSPLRFASLVSKA